MRILQSIYSLSLSPPNQEQKHPTLVKGCIGSILIFWWTSTLNIDRAHSFYGQKSRMPTIPEFITCQLNQSFLFDGTIVPDNIQLVVEAIYCPPLGKPNVPFKMF